MTNLYLIGFMGSGKTTVGRLLAERLGWSFADTDDEIVRKEGMDIPEIFAKGGESFFRDLEQATLLELSGRSGWVIATGGGIVLRGRNVEIMKASGKTVYLSAREDVLVARLVGDPAVRPLLGGDSRIARVHELLQERRGMYEWADLTIDTSDQTAQAVAEAIVNHFGLGEAGGRAVRLG
ncbi:shikimate kinase [Kyrpidia sp.]|uniref:shikimate kinase n=1 Tax=Kyrpidia sp. TaxID=2073077 RepID=UPI0025876F81|nr:shikimate kinase [Kyrpidia sp.]